LDTSADFVVELLTHYFVDLRGATASQLTNRWLRDYSATWVHLAVIEALYQGRYKAVSVEQILSFWQRRGQVVYHFNHEFVRLICHNFPQSAPVLASDGNNGYEDWTAVAADATEKSSPPVRNNKQPRLFASPNHSSIEQFTPPTSDSDFHNKLKAIAHDSEATQPHN